MMRIQPGCLCVRARMVNKQSGRLDVSSSSSSSSLYVTTGLHRASQHTLDVLGNGIVIRDRDYRNQSATSPEIRYASRMLRCCCGTDRSRETAINPYRRLIARLALPDRTIHTRTRIRGATRIQHKHQNR
jgi:hypothetical protein